MRSVFELAIVVAAYFVLMSLLVSAFGQGFAYSKLGFLLANRSMGRLAAGLTVAATWVWAPALFLSGQKAYTEGWIGLMWFVLPNVACLLVFGWFADRVRRQDPSGYTLTAFMHNRHRSRTVQCIYLVAMVGLAVCSYAVQLLAGSKVLSSVYGSDFLTTSMILSAGTLCYSAFSGLNSSIIASYVKLAAILCGAIIPALAVVSMSGGSAVVLQGAGGVSGRYWEFFSSDSWIVFISFGFPATIGLMSGPFGDQSFWQRAYATRTSAILSSFVLGAAVFAIVPLGMSLIGFAAAGVGFKPVELQMVTFEYLRAVLPDWTLPFFVFAVLAGLCTVLDSNMCAVASFFGHDFLRGRDDGRRPIFSARIGMLLLAIFGTTVANLRGIQIVHLFLIYGTLRATTLVPTIGSILSDRVTALGVTVGMIEAFVVALPVFVCGQILGKPLLSATGSLLTILLPLVSIWLLRIRTPTLASNRAEAKHT
jgi:Na+/proline symporter